MRCPALACAEERGLAQAYRRQTESIKDTQESAETDPKPTLTTREAGKVQIREAERPKQTAGGDEPWEGPRNATKPWRSTPTSRARKAAGNYAATGRGSAARPNFALRQSQIGRMLHYFAKCKK